MEGRFTLLQMSVRNPERSFCLLRCSRIMPGNGWSPFNCSNTYKQSKKLHDTFFSRFLSPSCCSRLWLLSICSCTEFDIMYTYIFIL